MVIRLLVIITWLVFVCCLFTGLRYGKLLEHLESSGTNVFMNGPILHKLCEGRKSDRRSLKMNFTSFLRGDCTIFSENLIFFSSLS